MRENARQLIDRAAGANGTTILTVSAKAGAASKVVAAQRPIARRFILFPPVDTVDDAMSLSGQHVSARSSGKV
jgi:hypothetical protein